MNAQIPMNPDIVHQTDGWQLRLATPADNARLCEIFRSIEMNAELQLSEERDPDFFALHRMHQGIPYTVVLEDTSKGPEGLEIVGCCSVIVREGWLDGQVRRIGYACDLRVLPTWRKARVFPLAVRVFSRYLEQREGVEVIFCAMLRDNVRAQGARLLAKGKLLTPYNMVSVQFVGKGDKPKHKVERATLADIPALQAFLSEQSKRRVMGFVYQQDTIERRLAEWPGLKIDDFYFIRNAQGEVVACTAPYDNEQDTRRSRVKGYSGRMVPLRKLYNAEAFLRNFLPLPKEGECFHYKSLTHFEVKDEDPALCQSLLRGVYQGLRGEPLHFFSAFIPEGLALEQAFRGFRTREIAMDLFYFPGKESRWETESLHTLLPGFEMALH